MNPFDFGIRAIHFDGQRVVTRDGEFTRTKARVRFDDGYIMYAEQERYDDPGDEWEILNVLSPRA